MNCKPGDLAVVVMCFESPEVVGKIVRCVEYKPCKYSGDAWIVDPPLCKDKETSMFIYDGNWINDECLRPIRDSDGEDEMLRIAGKPQEVNA